VIKQVGKGLDPEESVEQFLLSTDSSLLLRYEFAQYYLPGKPLVELLAIFLKDTKGCYFLMSDKLSLAQQALNAMAKPLTCESLKQLSSHLTAPLFNLGRPLLLAPIAISKPWGQEIWYTGIEARGQSGFSDDTNNVPIPWLLSLLPTRLLGAGQPGLNLLKILAPLPEPVYGDLYFELHEKKREVYVVTHVDRQSWPDGEGGIRFGFDTGVRQEFSSPGEFRQAYLKAVQAYEKVRRKIDEIFDQHRLEQNIGLSQPVAASQLKAWHGDLSVELCEEEASLRQAMNRFTHMQALREGDVVKVPCLTPHALQHGVRTVEFQTPVYERKILAFGQKVLTQQHWDTEEAVALMSLQAEPEMPLQVLEQSEGCCREQVVAFDDFQVQRVTLAPGASWQVPASPRYMLLMVVSGSLTVGAGGAGMELKLEQAVLLPAEGAATSIGNSALTDCIVLLAEPLAPA